ncbi:RHS repeat-associated core domain-containing protein [Pseudomonas carassii]|uniref:RHS repeat-associated core domain-containing protein n=1 Tax=Pseudomonas carassii TaxID=3115855 RepID=A0ABU7H798_9PSED|nr:RHS repeat-associated core domain-containing protein [Pseudomonas sp. 137P]MEE1887197.1 RHS repeat-associated core domain-containing protein [Pseudomonas sp. 137P]
MAQQLKQGTTSMLAIDKHGSVLGRQVCEAPKEFSYTPYGYDRLDKTFWPLLGFNAEPRTASGGYLLGNGYRSFTPSLMRFNSPDSYSPFGAGGINAFCYCLNDPVNRTDPSGHKSIYRHARSLAKGILNIFGRRSGQNSSAPNPPPDASPTGSQNFQVGYTMTPEPTPTPSIRQRIFDYDFSTSHRSSLSSMSELDDPAPHYGEVVYGELPDYERAMELASQAERTNDRSNDADRMREFAAFTAQQETRLPGERRGAITMRSTRDQIRRTE